MSDLIHSIPNPYEYIINHPTGNSYIHPTHNWYNQQRKQVWRKTQKNTTEAYVDQSNLVPRKVTKKVKSKLIKSTNVKEILQPNISFDDSGCFLNPKETLGFSGPLVCIRSVSTSSIHFIDWFNFTSNEKNTKMKLELTTSLTKPWCFLHWYNLFLHYKGHPCNNMPLLHSVS